MAKAALSKTKLQEILTTRLHLEAPQFVLENVGQKLSGSIISATFTGMKALKRQNRLWDALEAEFGAKGVRWVGTLLAYTPEEWDINLDASSNTRSKKCA